MKKAKLTLAAITIMAIVGGALAVKAAIPGTRFFTTDVAGTCPLLGQGKITTDPDVTPVYYTTALSGTTANCPSTNYDKVIPE